MLAYFRCGVVRQPDTVVAAAPLHTEPFPHIVVDGVLPQADYEGALAHWPAATQMGLEPGGIDRYMTPLADRERIASWGCDGAQFWHEFEKGRIAQVIDAAVARFRRYNVRRFGPRFRYDSGPSLFEAGPAFEQHGPHTHHNHNPDWIMSMLLFIDDGGREDRGEVFSAPIEGSRWLDIVSGSPAVQTRPMKRVAFKPNRLVAWLDGPMSYHGTDRLTPSRDRRRMIRSHVWVQPQDVHRALGVTVGEFFAATQAHIQGGSAALEKILEKPGNCVDALPRFSFSAV